MRKAIYSLVLSEEVVEAVDRMAYARGMSRSGLINQLLAEAVGYVTPEQRMAEILKTLSAQMEGRYQMQEQATDGILLIRSQLRYRYKPTIRYRVELYRNPEQVLGVLNVFFRTQNQELLADADDFFRWWTQYEQQHGDCTEEDTALTGGIWRRSFRIPAARKCTTEEIGAGIGQYINRLDRVLKTYFSALPDRKTARQKAAREAEASLAE